MTKIATAGSIVALLAIFTPTSVHAAPPRLQAPTADVTHTCGYVTCTSYYSREYTKNVMAPAAEGGVAAFAGVMAGLCSRGGAGAAAACAAAAAVAGGISLAAINQAAANNQCAAFVTDVVGHVGYFRTDNSGYCVDK